MSKYYDHNKIWGKRDTDNNPVWGSYSVTLYKRILEALAAFPGATNTLVDFGCGAGKFGEMAEEAGYKYLGIDDSGTAIALGKKSFPSLQLMEFDLATKDLPQDYRNWGASGTAINSLHCLTEETHRQQFLRNMATTLCPGAHLFLSTMVGPLSKHFRPSGTPRLYLEPDLIIEELCAAGFSPPLWRSDLPATDVNGIPNLEVVVQLRER